MPKYRNTRVEYDGMTFDSVRERDRWIDLTLLQRGGVIKDLQRQVTYKLEAYDKPITRCIIDFQYFDVQSQRIVLEDVKGYTPTKDPVTRLWQIKHKLIEAQYGHKVEIIK